MRTKLQEIKTGRFRAILMTVRVAAHSRNKGKLIAMLRTVSMGDKILCDHVWVVVPRHWRKMDLRSGDTIEFDADVEPYTKGNGLDRPIEQDYCLGNLRNINRVK